MRKDAFYFPHDSNAKDDPKCVLLIEQLGMEGYGIYWVLIETLRDQPSYTYPIALIPALARRYNTTTEKVKTVVCTYELFRIEDDKFFFSPSLNDRMVILEEKRQKRAEAGRLGNASRWRSDCNVSQTDRNATTMRSQCLASKVEKSKVKEKRVEGIRATFVAPSLADVVAYFSEKGYSEELAKRAFAYYDTADWKDGKGNPVKNWKQKMISVWLTPENANTKPQHSNESTYTLPV